MSLAIALKGEIEENWRFFAFHGALVERHIADPTGFGRV